MHRSSSTIAAVALTAWALFGSMPTPAKADWACCCPQPCVAPAPPPVMVYEPYQMPQIYIVDRGPVYSGPGIYTNPTVVLPRPMPHYPYVGRDYPYSDRHLPPYVEPLRARAQAVTPRRAARNAYR